MKGCRCSERKSRSCCTQQAKRRIIAVTDLPLIGEVRAPDLHVMSYNIRRRMALLTHRGPDGWQRRRPLIQRLCEAEQPTVIGVQEALPDQAGFIRHALGERYRSVGYGRETNQRGEGCPIFYDRDRLELLAWNQSALSSTPAVSGSKSWGNTTPRIVVSASFRDRTTGHEFRCLNTHFDHKSRNSRMRCADEILRVLATSALPTFVTGDFNTDAQSLPYERLIGSGALLDCWPSAAERITEGWGTFPNYRAPKLSLKTIDWILATPTIRVVKAAINVNLFDGKWPSDHAPVQVVATLGT